MLSLVFERTIDGAGKSNLIAIINEVIKIFAKVWNMSGLEWSALKYIWSASHVFIS